MPTLVEVRKVSSIYFSVFVIVALGVTMFLYYKISKEAVDIRDATVANFHIIEDE
ncbi:MAG: hypothetical protein Q8Q94_00575 [bacterium]|nr:hypothetical protein [bacterium]MDZ4299750.1 hypothetical protein [Candidatus Sungbacteria bacterium]